MPHRSSRCKGAELTVTLGQQRKAPKTSHDGQTRRARRAGTGVNAQCHPPALGPRPQAGAAPASSHLAGLRQKSLHVAGGRVSRLGTLGKVKQKKNPPCHNVLLTACHQTHSREQQLPGWTRLGPPIPAGPCTWATRCLQTASVLLFLTLLALGS